MNTGVVGQRGQVTIPKTIREKCGLDAGTRVQFTVEDGSVCIRQQRAKGSPFRKFVGIITDIEDVDAYVEETRGR